MSDHDSPLRRIIAPELLQTIRDAALVVGADPGGARVQRAREGEDGWEAYRGAQRAAIADRKRLHRLLDLYGAPPADDPAMRIVALGEALVAAREDMGRIEWLEAHAWENEEQGVSLRYSVIAHGGEGVRAAIDRARVAD